MLTPQASCLGPHALSPRASRLILALALASALLGGQRVAMGQLRVVNYNIAQRAGNSLALQNVLAALHADDKPGFAVPVGLFVFQEVRQADLQPLLDAVNASAPPGETYIAGTYTNINEDGFGGAQALIYRQGFLSQFTVTGGHIDLYTGAGRYTDRWRMQLVGYNQPSSWFYIYSSHLKSETSAADQAERLTGVQNIRTNSDGLGLNQHIIYAGDMNFYNSGEAAYQWFLSAGNGQAFDPLGSESWAGGAGGNPNNIKHTQSPRLVNTGGLVGGGLDDRFDFQLSTTAMHDGAGLAIIPAAGSYRALGNDGLHFGQAINNGNNFYYPGDLPRSNALAANLHNASDHVPVVVDYQVPAVLGGTIAANYGRVIQGAAYEVPATVLNSANVVTPIGADLLDYDAVGVLGFSGEYSGQVAALSPGDTHLFALNTSLVGPRNARVTITTTSQGVPATSLNLNTTGTIVRASNASFDPTADLDQSTLKASFDADSGVHAIIVPVHNLGYDALQALLDVDGVSALSPPVAFAGGLASGLGSQPAELHFTIDTDGLIEGQYNAQADIATSDEDLPGERSATLHLTLRIAIGGANDCPADINGDANVDFDDVLEAIMNWGPCPAPGNCPADVNGDGNVDFDDVLEAIMAWGPC